MSCAVIVKSKTLPPLPPLTMPSIEPATVPQMPAMEIGPPQPPQLPSLPSLPSPPSLPSLPAVPSLPTLTPVSGTAPSTVTGMLASSGALANASQSAALQAIGQLSGYAATIQSITPDAINTVKVNVPAPGVAPMASNLAPQFPAAPDEPVVGSVPAFTLTAPPVFDVAAPDVLTLPLPDPLNAIAVPEQPTLEAIPVPVEPDYQLPAVPTLLSLALPEAPTVDFPLFDAGLGAAPEAPDVELVFNDVAYHSTLFSAMQERLTGLAERDATGIDPDVEQAIYDRARDREALLTHRASDEALRLLRARGLAMPEGTLLRTVQQALQHGLRRDAALSRQIVITRAQLAQSNFKFALDSMIAIEGQLIELHNAAQARALQAAQAMFQSQLQLFNGAVLLFSAKVAGFGAEATAFKAKLERALADAERYRSELEGQRIIGQLNAQQVAIYTAKIDGLAGLSSIFKSRVAAAKTLISSEEQLIAAFRSHVAALEAQITAKRSEYENYAAAVRGELLKAEHFGTQVAAYRSQVGAFDALAKAKLSAQTLAFKQGNEFPLALYRSRIDGYQTAVSAAAERLRTEANVYSTRIKAFVSTEDAKTSHLQTQLEAMRAESAALVGQAELNIAAGRANLDAATTAAGIAQGNLRAAGQLTGQLAAAAIAAQGVHASISETGSMSTSHSESTSQHEGESVSQTEATSNSVTNGVSVSASVSQATNVSATLNKGRSFNKAENVSNSTHVSHNQSEQNSVSNSTTTSQTISDSFSMEDSCVDRTIHSD